METSLGRSQRRRLSPVARQGPPSDSSYCRFAWEPGGTRVADADADGIPACCAASDSVAPIFYFLSGLFSQNLG